MMEFTSRDFIYSLFLHGGLLILITLLNPFMVQMRTDFESVAVNIIEMPPLGDPTLIKAQMPEISIPQALTADEIAIPIETPESRTEPEEIERPEEKPKEKPKPKPKEDPGYKGMTQKADTTQAGGTDAVDNANFNYPYYFVQAFGKIQRNWSNPVAANQPLSCIIYFEVTRTGSILDSEIEKPSGVQAYDRACQRALQVSSPLPPLPSDFRSDIIGIHLEFPYKP
jgi:TonB family protein